MCRACVYSQALAYGNVVAQSNFVSFAVNSYFDYGFSGFQFSDSYRVILAAYADFETV